MAEQDKEQALSKELTLARNTVNAALLDSLNLSGATKALLGLAESANCYMKELEEKGSAEKTKGVRNLHGGHLVCSPSVPSLYHNILAEGSLDHDEHCEGLIAKFLLQCRRERTKIVRYHNFDIGT